MNENKNQSYFDKWPLQVANHHNQSIRAQDGIEINDFWQKYARNFRSDPFRTDDLVVNRLLLEVNENKSLLDVGGGAGRLSLPLSLKAKHVTVLDSSDSMLQELNDSLVEFNIKNICPIKSTWEEAQVGSEDIVLCSHVTYGVTDIKLFIEKLIASANEAVLILGFFDAPQTFLAPFWERVHKEERINLPGLSDLMKVLWELEYYPNLEVLSIDSSPTFESMENAIDDLRNRLYVIPDSEKDVLLKTAANELLVDTDKGLLVVGSKNRALGLVRINTSDFN
jgi:SAM-dependent methyltransferase